MATASAHSYRLGWAIHLGMPQHHVSDKIPEWRLQAEIAADLDRMDQPFAASLEGVKLNPYQAQMAKATGMKAGEPDVRLYFDGARLVFVELKVAGGYLNPAQRERVPMLRALGFVVHVVKAATPDDAVSAVREIVSMENSAPASSLALPSATLEK